MRIHVSKWIKFTWHLYLSGGATTATKKKKKKNKKKNVAAVDGSTAGQTGVPLAKGQTEPPTIPINQLFPDGNDTLRIQSQE